MIVDAHIHIWNRLHGKTGGGLPLVGLGGGMVRIGEKEVLGMPATFLDSLALAERFVAEMDASGVECGVVVQGVMDGEQNDYCLAVMGKYPRRFFCHGLADCGQPQTFEAQCLRLFEQGFGGVKICGGYLQKLGLAIDDELLMGVWRVMEARGFVLAVDLCAGESQVPQMEHVLSRFPGLKVAIGHFGMPTYDGWPGQLNLCRHAHVYLEMGGIVWLYRREGYPFVSAIKAICHARDVVGAHKLMWGSDWPRTMVDFTYRQSLSFVQLADEQLLSADEKRAILGENAARLYGLKSGEPRLSARLITEV